MRFKTIRREQLRIGMYVHSFNGSWLEHPFWSSRMLVDDEQTLQRILTSSIRELVIDLTRGLDVVGADEKQDASSRAGIADFAEDESEQSVVAAEQAAGVIGLQDELQRARQVFAKGKRAVVQMFQDARLGRTMEVEGLHDLIDEMSTSVTRNAHALVSVARIKGKDEYTYLHSVAVAALMIGLARQHGCDEHTVRMAGLAGLLHDMGKALTPDVILNKQGKLTDEEYGVMRQHPRQGWELLRSWPGVPEEVLDVCLHHHEKMDASGYPEALPGDGISLLSRMGAICDVYDAITSNRPYKTGWDPAVSLSRMAAWKGHFDPGLLQQFVAMLGIYPVGSLVRLGSEQLAVVVEQNPAALLKPVVSVFYSIRLRQKIPVWQLDLAQDGCADRIVGREQPENWNIRNLEKLWLPG